MFGCWVLPLNGEEYVKHETEVDSKIKEFGDEEWNCDDEEFEPLEEAYIVQLAMESYGVEYEGYYVVLIGDSHFDVDRIFDIVFGMDEDYEAFCNLKSKDVKALTKDEMALFFCMAERYSLIESCDLGEEFELLMSGEECSCGKIVKKIF